MAANYNTAPGSRQIEVLVDKVSIGTSSISTIGLITNTRNAYIGGLDNAGTIEDTLAAKLAYFFLQSKAYSVAEITSYHDDVRINTDSEKTSIHFAGDEIENSNPTLDA